MGKQKRAPTRGAPTEAVGNERGAKKSGLIAQVQSVRTNPGIDRVNVIVGATLVVARWDGKGLGLRTQSARNLFDPVAEQGLDWGGQFGENAGGQRRHGVFLAAGFVGQAAALVRAGAQDLDIEPPGGVAHDYRGAGLVRAVGRGRVPQAAVEHEHAAGWAAGVYFRGIRGQRIDAIVAGGIVRGAVAAGDEEGAAVFLGKGASIHKVVK